MEFHAPGGPIALSGMKKHGPPPWLMNTVLSGVVIPRQGRVSKLR